MEAAASAYPLQLDVAYPDRELDRLTTGFRIFTAIPILIVAGAIGGHAYGAGDQAIAAGGVTGGILFLPALLMLVFREK